MQERRKYVRLNIPLEVSYTTQGKQGASCKSITRNISPNGARFCIAEQLPKGSILNINIKIPERAEGIPVKARIVWSKKENSGKEELYDTGFEFVEIPEESKQLFFQYLCNFMYDQFKKM